MVLSKDSNIQIKERGGTDWKHIRKLPSRSSIKYLNDFIPAVELTHWYGDQIIVDRFGRL